MAVRRKKQAKPRKFMKSNRSKLVVVFGLIIAMFGVLVVRLTLINTTSGDKYEKIVLSQMSMDSSSLPYRRGEITDRNGTVLATSEKVYNLIFDPYVAINSNGECVEPTIAALVKYFGCNEGDLRTIIADRPNSRYVVLQKELTYDQRVEYDNYMASEEEADTATNAYVKGIWFEEEYLRKYPYDTLACDVLGFTARGNVGLWGLEGYYDSELNGINGRTYNYVSETADLETEIVAPVNGYNLVSTIDVNVQRVIEKNISDFNTVVGSKNTAVIVADPNTGEILGMASYPIFNCNDPYDLSYVYTKSEQAKMSNEELSEALFTVWRNFCVNDAFEPGSTFKPMTVSAALDLGVITQTTQFICDGGETFSDGTWVSCNGLHNQVDTQGALVNSCNDALMQMAEKMGISEFVKAQNLFNFGELSGIDLLGEESGIVYDSDGYNVMHEVELGTCSFGQGATVNMVQMIAAFSSTINGGYYYKPHMVKRIETETGSVISSIGRTLVKNTVSAETSDFIREALYQTVEVGSGSPAQVTGYKIGGKTGTAEKIPRSEGRNLVSFMGFAPADDPQVVVYVIIDEPKVINQADSSLASTMAGKIFEEILPYLQIFPDGENEDIFVDIAPETTETVQETTEEEETTEETTEAPEEETEEETINEGLLEEYLGNNNNALEDDEETSEEDWEDSEDTEQY